MLSLENLSLFYGEDKVLNNVTLQVNDGECVLLTGESGSGKSSIIKSINGLAFEYENANITGNIEINEKKIKNLELYEISLMISSVFQNPKTHFFNVNTTIELLFYLENIGLDRTEMENRMKNMLKIFPIEHLLNRSIFELSGGEKQILCVASCYISGCKIIVLDEPSSNLDYKYIQILKKMLQILKNKGITIIIAEHRIYYIMDIVDRIFLVKNGKIVNEWISKNFLSISDEELIKLGLRSNHLTKLNINKLSSNGNFEVKKLCCIFNDKKLDIKNLSFNFKKIYGIIGKNGCGKSTFLKNIIGLSGKKNEIYLNGKKISKKYIIKNSSLVMQDVNHQLFSNSVYDELRLGIKNITDDSIDKVLKFLKLDKFKDIHPMNLSGGEKQRVAIASVFCKNSKFIFFDEPTSGMDYNNMVKISEIIKNISNEENIIFIVSHDTEFLNLTVDEIINLEDYILYS